MPRVYVCLFLAIFIVSYGDLILAEKKKKAVIWSRWPCWTYLRKKPIHATVAENVLDWLRKAVYVIMCCFQNMPAKANLLPAFIVACYISFLYERPCAICPLHDQIPILFLLFHACPQHTEGNLDSMSIFWRGCSKSPVRQRNVNCHISKSWKWWNETFIVQKSMSLTLSFLFTFTEMLPYLQLPPTCFHGSKAPILL